MKKHPIKVCCVVGSFAQDRDAALQEEEEERADSNLRKVTIQDW
jgi:hypothetical protein